MEQNENVTEIRDQRDPKQKLIVNNSNIAFSEFINCYAEGCKLHDISLPKVSISYADLRECNFNDMNMINGRISDANLTGLTIDGVNITGITIKNAGADEPVLFDNLNIPEGSIVNSNLTNVKLENCKIEGLTIDGLDINKLIEEHKAKHE